MALSKSSPWVVKESGKAWQSMVSRCDLDLCVEPTYPPIHGAQPVLWIESLPMVRVFGCPSNQVVEASLQDAIWEV